MTNGKLLKEIAKAKQVTLQELAEALGLTRQGLSKKIENRSEFRVSEVSKLSEILGLSEQQKQEIFFAM
jgi:transcriptional regulator with XRE-family HTH domain